MNQVLCSAPTHVIVAQSDTINSWSGMYCLFFR